MLNGAYPTKGMIKESIVHYMAQFEQTTYQDIMPWNMILQGTTIELIDQDDTRNNLTSYHCLDFSLSMLEETHNAQDLLHWFKPNYLAFIGSFGGFLTTPFESIFI